MPKQRGAQAAENVIEVDFLDTRAQSVPDSFDEEARTVDFIASTGARGLRRRRWDDDYWEELEVSEQAVRLDRFNNQAPMLDTHDSWDVSKVLGSITRAWIENGNLMVTVKFSRRPEVEDIFRDIQDGILAHVSVGYNVWQYDITDREGELDVYRAVDWEPIELSLVPMGFDDGAVARSARHEKTSAKLVNRVEGPKTSNEDDAMPEGKKRGEGKTPQNETDTGLTADQVDAQVEAARAAGAEAGREEGRAAAEQAREEAVAAERKRGAEIRAAVRASGLDSDYAEELIADEAVSVDEARKRIIDKWAAEGAEQETRGVRTGIDNGLVDQRRDAVVNALHHRANPEIELQEGARQYAPMSLLRLSEELMRAEGVDVNGMYARDIAARAMSTSDLPIIAGNLMNRTLLDGYETTPRTFVGVFRQASARDFRPVHRTRLSGAPMLEEITEGGEFKYGKLTDEKETYSLATYGKALRFTRQMIINDDLDALTRIPRLFGAAAADLESDLVWAILSDNAALSDGFALFHAAEHGNLGSASAIDVPGVGAGRAAMRKQTGMEGRLINIMPRHIIVGADKETELDQFRTQITANSQGDAQPTELRTLNPVVEPRIAGNAWYLAADHNRVDTIEYCFLEGEQGVYLETGTDFSTDGMSVKARHDFAAKAIDYRGLYRNPGN